MFVNHGCIVSHREFKNIFSYSVTSKHYFHTHLRFPGGTVVKNSPPNAGDAGSIPRSGRFAGAGNGKPFPYTCLENSMNRGAWQATVYGAAKESVIND